MIVLLRAIPSSVFFCIILAVGSSARAMEDTLLVLKRAEITAYLKLVREKADSKTFFCEKPVVKYACEMFCETEENLVIEAAAKVAYYVPLAIECRDGEMFYINSIEDYFWLCKLTGRMNGENACCIYLAQKAWEEPTKLYLLKQK